MFGESAVAEGSIAKRQGIIKILFIVWNVAVRRQVVLYYFVKSIYICLYILHLASLRVQNIRIKK